MTIKIKELNIKATLSGEQEDTNQENTKEQIPASSLIRVFYDNGSPTQNQER